MTLHNVWYFAVETTIDGERRGFSRQIRAGEDRTRKIPKTVENICQTFLSDALAGSDVHTYDAVERGERFDWPYRFASYHLTCNGETVVRSFAGLPVKPCVLV
jgi:hypothetical protein